MDRKHFMEELEFLLSDISEEERKDALLFYQDYFDEAGKENEQKVMSELGEPSRIAAIIKDGLKGNFEKGIHVGNEGFSNQDYQRTFEVISSKETTQKSDTASSHIKTKWNHMHSRDRGILIILAVLIILPIAGLLFGAVSTVWGIGISIAATIFGVIFGVWIITFVLHIVAFILGIVGICQIFIRPGAGLICLGLGLVSAVFARLSMKVAKWFFKVCIPTIANVIADGVGKILRPRGV